MGTHHQTPASSFHSKPALSFLQHDDEGRSFFQIIWIMRSHWCLKTPPSFREILGFGWEAGTSIFKGKRYRTGLVKSTKKQWGLKTPQSRPLTGKWRRSLRTHHKWQYILKGTKSSYPSLHVRTHSITLQNTLWKYLFKRYIQGNAYLCHSQQLSQCIQVANHRTSVPIHSRKKINFHHQFKFSYFLQIGTQRNLTHFRLFHHNPFRHLQAVNDGLTHKVEFLRLKGILIFKKQHPPLIDLITNKLDTRPNLIKAKWNL